MKEMFYLMMHSTHLCLQLYGVGHVIKNQSERKPAPSLHRLSGKGYFYMHHPTDRIAHTMDLLHRSWSTGWNEK